MAKFKPGDIVADVQALYGKDTKGAEIISTGATLKREWKDEDCLCVPTDHVWRELTGLPGIPLNKIVQVAGEPDAGKSTLAAEFMIAAQKAGWYVVLWDAEQKFDPVRFKKLGGDPDSLYMVATNEILKGGGAAIKYVRAIKARDPGAKILLVWDSVGGSQSRSHAGRDLDNEKHGQPGQDAKENSSVMKVLVANINKYPDSLCVYMANQAYAKIGFMQHGTALPGGKKIEFHSSLIIKLKPIKVLKAKKGGKVMRIGCITQATIQKNHLSQTGTTVYSMNFKITYAEGSHAGAIELGKKEGEDESEAEES